MQPATLMPPKNPPAILSLRNYRHLAAHHGHDLTVAIYGGEQSAALECETCHTILVAFENTPGPDAEHAVLLARTRRQHIESGHIAPHLAGAAQQQAAAINEQGVDCQLAYLLAILGAQRAREVIDRIVAETRGQ
jgi:hypothetical protein